MTIQQFIEKAIEGGWYELSTTEKPHRDGIWNSVYKDISFHLHRIMLDPLAWQAVGKVKGWGANKVDIFENCEGMAEKFEYQHQIRMHAMIDALCAGSSVEDYLKTL